MKAVKLALLILLLPAPSSFAAGLGTTGQAAIGTTNVRADALNEPEINGWDQDSHFSILLGWAAHLSTYERPAKPPSVQFKDYEFFVEHACNGRDCNVLGWYNDTGIVYIDRRLQAEDTVFSQSLLVHEFVHYLQDLSGKYESGNCEDSVAREREAYQVQRDYIMVYGTMPLFSTIHRNCIEQSHSTVGEAEQPG